MVAEALSQRRRGKRGVDAQFTARRDEREALPQRRSGKLS